MIQKEITTEVVLGGIVFTHTHVQEFADDSNVFGQVLEYRKYINETFPNRQSYKLLSAKTLHQKPNRERIERTRTAMARRPL